MAVIQLFRQLDPIKTTCFAFDFLLFFFLFPTAFFKFFFLPVDWVLHQQKGAVIYRPVLLLCGSKTEMFYLWDTHNRQERVLFGGSQRSIRRKRIGGHCSSPWICVWIRTPWRHRPISRMSLSSFSSPWTWTRTVIPKKCLRHFLLLVLLMIEMELALIRRIAATISIRLLGRGTSKLPMYCRDEKQLDQNFSIPPSLVAKVQRWWNNPKAKWRNRRISRNTNPTDGTRYHQAPLGSSKSEPCALESFNAYKLTIAVYHSIENRNKFLFNKLSLSTVYGLLAILPCTHPKTITEKPWKKAYKQRYIPKVKRTGVIICCLLFFKNLFVFLLLLRSYAFGVDGFPPKERCSVTSFEMTSFLEYKPDTCGIAE